MKNLNEPEQPVAPPLSAPTLTTPRPAQALAAEPSPDGATPSGA